MCRPSFPKISGISRSHLFETSLRLPLIGGGGNCSIMKSHKYSLVYAKMNRRRWSFSSKRNQLRNGTLRISRCIILAMTDPRFDKQEASASHHGGITKNRFSFTSYAPKKDSRGAPSSCIYACHVRLMSSLLYV